VALTLSAIDWQTVASIRAGSVQSFVGVAVLSASGFGLGWVNMAADYSRNLPKEFFASGGYLAGYFRRLTWPGFSCWPLDYYLPDHPSGYVMECRRTPIGALTTLLPTWFLVPFVIAAVLGLVSVSRIRHLLVRTGSSQLRLGRFRGTLLALADGILMGVVQYLRRVLHRTTS